MKFLSKIYDFMFAPAGTHDAESGLFDATNDEHFSAADTVDHNNVYVPSASELIINPATNLPMTDGIGSIDIAGSPFGIDVHHQIDAGIIDYSSPFPDCGNGFDYGLSTFDSGCSVDYGSNFDSGSIFD